MSRSSAQSSAGAKQLVELANAGHVDALAYMCGWCLSYRQLEKAEQWALKALERGEYLPLVKVALDWIYGKEGWDRSLLQAPTTRGRDPRRGLRLLTWAARRGVVGAISYLACFHQDGGSFGSNEQRALLWTRRGAALGDPDCITNLGVRYFYGNGVRRDRGRATALYRRAAALDEPSAAYNLGLQYQHGDGVRKNARLAVHWMRRATELGTSSGWLRLADYYFEGSGVPLDKSRGLACLRRAQRTTWRADREIARRKLWGEGLRLDVKGGLAILRARIRAGDTEAMERLGDWYHDVKEDYPRAVVLYRRAARLGSSDGMTSLHDCLSGDHARVSKNDRAALRWLRRALALENDGAYYRMGERLVAGKGVTRNVPKGLKFIRRSIDAHIGNASQAMGEILLARARRHDEVREALGHLLEARRLGVDQVESSIRECRRRLRRSARRS
jgi:uncharacterized protein